MATFQPALLNLSKSSCCRRLNATVKTLDYWRDRIDQLDLELVRLLGSRTTCAIEIGKIKAVMDAQVYDPDREEEVMKKVVTAATGSLTPDAVRRIFERIIDETRRAERQHRKLLDEEKASGKEKEP